MNSEELKDMGFSTRAIHAGKEPTDEAHGALSTPIYQTSTFCFESIEEGIAKFKGEIPGYMYSRGGNPTVVALQEKLAILEGGEACVATSSGMGAVGSVMLGLLRAGDHVVFGDCVYGCTDVVIETMLPRFGIEVTPVDTSDLDAVEAALRPNTKMIYFETPTNPMMKLTDIAGVARLARGRGIKVVVDNTFAPPPVQRPLDLGADLVVHSMTKYLNGHGDVLAGCVIGSAEDIDAIRVYASTKISGSVLGPAEAFLVIRGLQTLGLRMQRHCENALALAKWLEASPKVKRVLYAGLESSPQHELAKRQMNGLYSGMFSFEFEEGINGMSSFEAGEGFADSLKLAHIAVSLGDPSSLVEHPMTMTHDNVSPEGCAQMGITEGVFRFSAGLEDTADLIADFEQALSALE